MAKPTATLSVEGTEIRFYTEKEDDFALLGLPLAALVSFDQAHTASDVLKRKSLIFAQKSLT